MKPVENRQTVGVMVFKGIKVGFRPGDIVISIGADGQETMTATACTTYSMIPVWLKIAHTHRNAAKIAKANLDKFWEAEPDRQGDLLFDEMLPAIQVFVACATALDGLYSVLKPHSGIPPDTFQKWRKKRTARSAQVFSVIHQLYRFPNDLGRDVKQMLDEIYKPRDQAVHPAHELQPAMARPDIPVGLDWRFCVYRFDSCDLCYNNTVKLIGHLYDKRSNNPNANHEVDNILAAMLQLGLVSVKKPQE